MGNGITVTGVVTQVRGMTGVRPWSPLNTGVSVVVPATPLSLYLVMPSSKASYPLNGKTDWAQLNAEFPAGA